LIMKKSLTLTTLLFIGLNAYEFNPIGFKSIAMGGAGVASADATNASYYNPAILAVDNSSSSAISLEVSVGLSESNIAQNMDYLNDNMLDSINITESKIASGLSSVELDNIIGVRDAFVSMAKNDTYLKISPTQSLSIRTGSFGLSLYNIADIYASVDIDSQENIEDYSKIVVDTSNGYYELNPETGNYTESNSTAYNKSFIFSADKTEVNISALVISEVPLSYATKFETDTGVFAIGGSLKYLRGESYQSNLKVNSKSGDIEDNFDVNDSTTANSFGFDLGIIYQPLNINNLRLGFVAKNINTPTLEFEDDYSSNYKIELEPMVRAGLTYRTLNLMEFSFDADLTENGLNDELKSQYIGGGLSFAPFESLSLRAGAMKDIALDDSDLIYSAGFSLGLGILYLDVAAQTSATTTEVDGEEIPAYNRVNVALVSKW
jgi:hypothetical protein